MSAEGAKPMDPKKAAGISLAVMEKMARGGMHGNLAQVIFNKYDKDQDGFVDKGELQHLCMEMGTRLSEDELTLAIKILDTDGDDKIQFPEFKKWWDTEDRFARLRRSEAEIAFLNNVLSSFISFDKNNDGVIDREEFKNLHGILASTGYKTHSEQDDWDDMDRDHNGHISFNEFVDWLIRGSQQKEQPAVQVMSEDLKGNLPAKKE